MTPAFAPIGMRPPEAMLKQIRVRDWLTASTCIAFLAGLLTNVRFQLVGKASVGEVLLVMVAVLAVVANLGNPKFWNRRVAFILAAMAVTFAGYILSDLVNSTPTDRLIRGWARMAFVIGDFLGIWALVRRNIASLLAICFGDAFSGVLSIGQDGGGFLFIYKAHIAVPLTTVTMIAIPLILRRPASLETGLGMISVGMLHLFLDCRAAGAVCILVGFVLIARSLTASRFRSLYVSVLALALACGAGAILYLYSTTDVEFSSRRQGSNDQRSSLLMVGISAIERSPIVGLGSWYWDTEMRNVFISNMNRADAYLFAEEDVLNVHSQILTSWMEAGLLGMVFFVYYGNLMTQSLFLLFARRPLDFVTPLFLDYLLGSFWNLLFSPFANLHRFSIALALIISMEVMRTSKAARVAKGANWIPVMVPVAPQDTPGRVANW